MGFINKAKGTAAGKAAAQAVERDDKVLVYKFIEANAMSLNTGAMPGMSEQIQAIEEQGWTLANMAAGEGKTIGGGERIALICLFRRT